MATKITTPQDLGAVSQEEQVNKYIRMFEEQLSMCEKGRTHYEVFINFNIPVVLQLYIGNVYKTYGWTYV